ncbi:hypothetical protein JM946_21515 [Steroidobacter sp. S1-65]|uniref:Uncharacterized protein n=1 Tax=Steroidobacter gossypii TaxID=2805490 RepID=A0ABS1X275_9GAMM|nr:hypothetical protein [Steroidobacter gossypii]MBM0107325.1 hypothetical protein [Steroidobacter gossypii]
MKKHMALGAAMLTLGTAAAAGSFLYGQPAVEQTMQIALPADHETLSQEATPDMIAMWKATAASTEYVAHKAPI